MRNIRYAGALGLLTTALVMLVASGSTQPDTTFLAVVHGDGSMIPIAVFDDGSWWDRWPSPYDADLRRLPLPASIDTIPVEWLPPGMRLPTEWLLQRSDGTRTRIFAERPIRTVGSEPDDAIGIHTDYRFRGTRDSGGVAIAGTGTLGRFIPPPHAESKRLLAHLRDRLHAAEQAAIARWRQGYELTPDDDHSGTLTQVFNWGDSAIPPPHLSMAERPFKGLTYYHLTGEKMFTMSSKGVESCGLSLFFEGVVTTTPEGRVVSEGVSASGTSCGDPGFTNESIATVQWKDRLLWVLIENLEDGHNYRLVDPNSGEQVGLKK